MALIGSISIRLGVQTRDFQSKLTQSSKDVAAFSRSIAAGGSQMSKGLGQVAGGLSDLGIMGKGLAGDVYKQWLDPVTSIITGWASYLGGEIAHPIRSSFAHAFATLGGAVRPALAKTSGALARWGGKASAFLMPKVDAVLPYAVALGAVGKGFAVATAGALRFGVGLGKVAATSALGALSRMASTLPSIGRSFLSVGAAAGKFAGVGVVIAGVLGVKAASSAAQLGEVLATTEQVYGKSADGIIRSANEINAAFGTSRKEYLEGANALGSQLQGAGYSEKDSATLSDKLLKLAADANASRGGGFEAALGKIRSGLSGEAEPLKAWGIAIDDASVKAQALTMGLVKQGQELDNAAKVQARLALVTQGLAKDQGALARESEGPAAQMAEFWGRVETLWETIGTSLAPALGAALQGINEGIVALGLAWEASRDSVGAWASSTLEGLGFANDGVGILQGSIGFLADAWGVAKGAVAGFFSYVEAGISKLSGWLAKVFGGLAQIGAGEWASDLQGFFDSYSEAAGKLSEDLSKTMADAFAPTSLASKGVNKFFEDAAKKINGAKASIANAPVEAIGKPNASAVPAKQKRATDPFAAAQLAGSADAASTILRSRYGAGKDETAAQTKRAADGVAQLVKAQKDTNKLLLARANGVETLEW